MKTIFDLYELAARQYNENLHILKEEPETVSAFGVNVIRSDLQDLKVKMSTLEEVYDVIGGTYIKQVDDQGYIVKLTLHHPLFSYTSVFDFDAYAFVTEEFTGHIDKTSTP